MHEIQQQLLAMYENAQILAPIDFLDVSIECFQKCVEFDKSILIYGRLDIHDLAVSTVHLHNLPLEKLRKRLAIKEVDPVLELAKQQPEKSVAVVIADIAVRSPALYQHAMEFDQEQALTFCSKKSVFNGEQGLISLYRVDPTGPFTATDLAVCDFFLPHLFVAHQINLKLVSKAATQAPHLLNVIAAKDGRLYFLESEVIDLMRKEWPDWSPPMLPQELIDSFAVSDLYCGKSLLASVKQDRDLLFVKLSAVKPAKLTAAELRVSRLAVKGLSYKEIAKSLSVSPSTINNQLQSVYRKLAISNKVELGDKLVELLDGHGG